MLRSDLVLPHEQSAATTLQFALNAVAAANMAPMLVTLVVSHSPMYCLKAEAVANMASMVVTSVVFQSPMA